jgi:hypothetical protein
MHVGSVWVRCMGRGFNLLSIHPEFSTTPLNQLNCSSAHFVLAARSLQRVAWIWILVPMSTTLIGVLSSHGWTHQISRQACAIHYVCFAAVGGRQMMWFEVCMPALIM